MPVTKSAKERVAHAQRSSSAEVVMDCLCESHVDSVHQFELSCEHVRQYMGLRQPGIEVVIFSDVLQTIDHLLRTCNDRIEIGGPVVQIGGSREARSVRQFPEAPINEGGTIRLQIHRLAPTQVGVWGLSKIFQVLAQDQDGFARFIGKSYLIH
jgi:hypothetical protein